MDNEIGKGSLNTHTKRSRVKRLLVQVLKNIGLYNSLRAANRAIRLRKPAFQYHIRQLFGRGLDVTAQQHHRKDKVEPWPAETACDLCSISTLSTETSVDELHLLLSSIQIHMPDVPVFLIADTPTKTIISNAFPDLNIHISTQLDRYHGLDRQGMEKQGIWLDFMLEKCTIIDLALSKTRNTLLVDADVVFLHPVPAVPDKNIGLSPHYVASQHTDDFGIFNAGFVFVQHHAVTEWWRRKSKEDPGFFEQQALDSAPNQFNAFEFPNQYNFGWWQLWLSTNPQEVVNEFWIKDHKIYRNDMPLISVHTHFVKRFNQRYTPFNDVIRRLARLSKDPQLIDLVSRNPYIE
ncbi:MAG: hypothetical protein OES20_17665 [Gammaproteobacteria bacterium]|nr:hypothetical protein [Gammaproteobacteria bacterium]